MSNNSERDRMMNAGMQNSPRKTSTVASAPIAPIAPIAPVVSKQSNGLTPEQQAQVDELGASKSRDFGRDRVAEMQRGYTGAANTSGINTSNVNNERKALIDKFKKENAEKAKLEQQTKAFDDPKLLEQRREAEEQEVLRTQQSQAAEAQAQQARAAQDAFISKLQQQASSGSNPAVTQQLNAAADRASAQRRAISASQPSSAAGARGMQRANANQSQQVAQQQQLIKAQTQQAAQAQLAQALAAQRGGDLQGQQYAGQAGMQQQQLAQALQQAQQGAAQQGVQLGVEEKLAADGARLQGDIARMSQPSSGQGLGAALGGIGGAVFGSTFGPAGTAIGGQLGGQLGGELGSMFLNKGGKVGEDNKMKDSKIPKHIKAMGTDAEYGYQKALESQSDDSNVNYAGGGDVRANITKADGSKKTVIDPKAPKSKEQKREEAFTVQGTDKIDTAIKARKLQKLKQEQLAASQNAKARAGQSALASQLQQPSSLANVQLKAASDNSLQQQMAAANAGKRQIPAAQLQQALLNAQQQQAGQLTAQAGAQQAQSQMQQQQMLNQLLQQQRGADVSQSQFTDSLAGQQLAQQLGLAQQQQKARLAGESLRVDELAAVNAMNAQRDAASAANSGGGILSGITSALGFNEGGKVPGIAPVKGDNIKNDIVDAKLSPGEIVIPITVVDKGEEAMIGFIKALAENSKSSKGKEVQNYSKGGVVESDLKLSELEKIAEKQNKKDKKESSAKAQLGASIASSAMSAIAASKKRKVDAKKKEAAQAHSDFKTALGRIKGRRNYAKGGVVESSYGSLLKAKRELDDKIKSIESKKKK
jgi:hypothetical protein